MISAELKNGKYLIKFRGKKQQFNEYINKIMKLPKKDWDLDNKCWSIPQGDLPLLQKFFKDIDFLEEIQLKDNNIVKSKRKITGYENMGKSMKLSPYNYQKEAIKFSLDSLNSLLVLPCGSGKSPIGIGIYLEAKEQKIIKGPGMIVVKASLKTQWAKEIEKFSDLKAIVIQTKSECTSSIKDKIKRRKESLKKGKFRGKILTDKQIQEMREEILKLEVEIDYVFDEQFNNADLYVLNYEALKDPEIKAKMHKIKPQFIFSDEIHYCKNRTSKRSEALYEFGEAKMKIGATATPVGKNPEDIFGLFKFINPTLFSSWNGFAKQYIKYAGFGKISAFKNLDHLTKKISPYLIVKTKEEISDQLPSLLVMQRYCDFTPEQAAVNDDIMSKLDELHELENTLRYKCKSEAEANNNQELNKTCALILAHQTFAQELADAPELLASSDSDLSKQLCPKNKKSQKLNMCLDLIDEILDSGEKVCIFSKYTRMQNILTEAINKQYNSSVKIAYINGSLNDKQRYEEAYTKFRDDDNYKVLLCSDAGAEGLNLSKCKYLIEYDLAESYAIQTQRHGRLERADSIHDNVFVYQLINNDSWDGIQAKIIDKKEGYDTEIIKSLGKKD